jgi:hypothetical protein
VKAKTKIVAGVLVTMATVWVGYKLTRHAGFDDGWEAGRCYDWEQMNQMAKYYGFDRSKIFDTERESFERSCDIVAKWSNEGFLTKLFE